MITKYVVFDFGGTLAEYKDLPKAWNDYYKDAFLFLSHRIGLHFTDIMISDSCEILCKYNARLYPREYEISDKTVFQEINEILRTDVSAKNLARTFYAFFQQRLFIYDETLTALKKLRNHNCKIGVLSDLPTAMPHESFLEDIEKIGFCFDVIESSQSIKWRKPCIQGIEKIAEQFTCNPNEITYIGDEKKDIEMINKMNGVSVLINRTNESKPYNQRHEIKNVLELGQFLV